MTATEHQRAFTRRLQEAISWCSPRVDVTRPRWSLRSKELCPPTTFDTPGDPTFWNRPALIEHVLARRAELYGASSETGILGGRLLSCEYERTNHNYGADSYSRGYFDGFDNPPWDTWVLSVDGFLISWVPEEFLSLASEGMAVECIGMLRWVTGTQGLFPQWLIDSAAQLEDGGLL